MSYADVAAQGPKQSDAEKVPPAVPEIMHEDSSVHSLDSLGSVNDHVQSLPSTTSYADQQLESERAEEARQDAERVANETAREAKDFILGVERDAKRLERDFPSKAQRFGKSAEKDFEKDFEKVKTEAKKAGNKAKKDAKSAEDWADKNKSNPVVVGNGIVIVALAALLGTGAYRMHKANTLTWKVVGVWTGAVGLFAVGDYFVSQYFFKRYPPKN